MSLMNDLIEKQIMQMLSKNINKFAVDSFKKGLTNVAFAFELSENGIINSSMIIKKNGETNISDLDMSKLFEEIKKLDETEKA